MRRTTRSFFLLAVLLAACQQAHTVLDNMPTERIASGARAVGILSEEDHPYDLLVLCDASQYSTCSAESLRQTFEQLVLPIAAAHPGSRVRLYTLGEDVTARMVATAESTPASRETPKLIEKHAKEWTTETLALFTTAATPLFDTHPAQRSRIAEALTRLAAADAVDSAQRVIVYLGDMRETAIAKLECGQVPSPDEWLRRLDEHALLSPHSLQGARVLFTNTSITNPDSVQCDTVARSTAIKELWRTAVTRAGATITFHDTTPNTL